MFKQRLAIPLLGILVLCGSASATTRSSFLDVDGIVGITAPTSNGGRTYTLTVGANPSFILNNVTYTITDVIGFYVLSDDIDFSPLLALSSVGPSSAFTDDSGNAGPGGVAGWRSNPNSGLVPNQSLAFTYPTSFPLASIDRIGLHVRLNGTFPGTTGNTGNITGAFRVPSPAAGACLGLGAMVAFRRRRA